VTESKSQPGLLRPLQQETVSSLGSQCLEFCGTHGHTIKTLWLTPTVAIWVQL